jgi:hypothetical protein
MSVAGTLKRKRDNKGQKVEVMANSKNRREKTYYFSET